MSSLSHHGIKGQRWGVRRFQNKDGTRTAAGKKHEKTNRLIALTSKDYSSIRKSLSDHDLKMLNYDDEEIKYMREHDTLGHDHAEYGQTAHRVIQKDKNGIPVAYVDATGFTAQSLLTGKMAAKVISIDLATRAGDEYRGKGYAIAAGKKMVKWFDTYGYKDYEYMEWAAKEENVASQKVAEKLGFKNYHTSAPGWTLYTYERKAKHTSIGGTMYIEGNTLILGDSSYLSHHGIKGQRWGIRRFQNEDGSLTPLGEKRIKKLKKIGDKHNKQQALLYGQSNLYSAKSIQPIFGKFKNLDSETEVLKAGAKINRIATENEPLDDKRKYVSFTSGDNAKYKFFAEVKELGLPKDAEPYAYQFRAIKDIRIANGKAIESFIVNDIKATSTSKKQKEEAKKIIEAFDKHLDNEAIIQGASKVLEKAMSVKEGSDNHFYKEAGIKANDQIDLYRNTIKTYLEGDPKKVEKLADHLRSRGYDAYLDMVDARSSVRWKYGTDYPLIMMSPKDNMELVKSEKLKHTSIGGTMYIEGNTLILGDSSYLEHHGIKGQRWGIRRFQNRDGSLTNTGRKRLGYATKGATQAVKKAFKAGVKTGAKAVKAAKAHHEKAEAKKIEKKKEKASKTRAGVYANKDLFTAKELKELNSKFEEQDKLTMARINHGVEIAKSVGDVAKSAGEVGKAYEALTGHKLIPDIMALQNGGNGNNNNNNPPNNPPGNQPSGNNNNNPPNNQPNGGNGNNNNPPGSNNPPGNKPNWTNTPPNLPTPPKGSGLLAGLKKGLNLGKPKIGGKQGSDSDLQDQIESAKKQVSKAMKNAKLQAYIDAYNRDQNSEKNSELASRGQKAIEVLSKGGGFTSEEPKSSASSTPKAMPSSNNLMAQIKAAQTKLEKPNKNETPAEHKEAQKKLNALEKAANEYKAAVNKPGTDSAEVAEKLLKKNKDILDDLKHMDFSDTNYLEHHGVRGMKWGKHLMAGKGGNIYDGTALGGGGGGPMTEEERKKAEELRKKKLEEAKKKAEEAAKEKEIEEKAEEIGISAKAYKRYSIDNNHLPGKHHYDKSQKLHGEASSSVAEAQASARQAHMNRAKAASLNRKVNSSHLFDADGYHISQQRGDDHKEAKRLEKEAKQLDKKSKKALKKFYKKRYKADKERQKWQNSTSGKYHHLMRHYEIQNGVLFVDSSDGLTHHGVKGQRQGVRRFQNEDGSLTPKGRKHYEKAIAKEKRKQASSDAIRGTLERLHPFAVTGSAISAAVSAGLTHATYSVSEAWEGRGTRMRSKKIAKYENMLKQSDMEEGMYHVENGTLFINAGEPYLEHHGVKGMKWGKHLMAGKGVDAEGGGGGGFAEDDEKLKEMAKKAGMSVAEYKQKFASKIGGAASKVGSAVYDAAGGSHKKNAEGWRKMAREESNAARASERSSHENSARAASQDRKYGSGGDVYRRAADSDKENAEIHRSNAKGRSERAASEQAAYEKSLAGRYDKMKADRVRSKKLKQRQSIERALSNGPVEAKPKKSLGKRLEEKLGVTHETTNKPKQSKEAKRIEGMFKDAARKDKAFSGTSPKAKKKVPLNVLNSKHTDTSHRRKSVGEIMNNAKNPTPGDTPIPNPTQYTHANRPRGREKYFKLGQESRGVKKRSRRVRHFDGSNELYTEGTRLVVNSKWG